jgi:pantocin A family RiPP
MSRLTKRISVVNEEAIVYTKGEYTNTTAGEMRSSDVREVMRKLAEYEDLEEQGLLLKLPCKVGTTVYVIGCKYRNGTFEKWINTGKFNYSDLEKLNNTVFLTKEEAEQELKRLEGAE